MRIWIVGPIAWDTVLYVNNLPNIGGFTHAKEHQERPGGQALNIAVALTQSGFETGIFGYVGNDEYGKKLIEFAKENIPQVELKELPHPTPHVVVLVDANGERTMVGMEQSYFGEISINMSMIKSEDIVVWPIWRTAFADDLKAAKAKGCRTIVGLGALNSELTADIAIGSAWELPTDFDYLRKIENFDRIIATNNNQGATEYSRTGINQASVENGRVVDTTGAGDAFICGIIKGLVENKSKEESLKIAGAWAAHAVASKSSIPPKWDLA